MPGLEDELMTVAEVAATLKLNQQTIRNWIEAGTLPCVRVGVRRVRVYRSDFEKLLGRSRVGSGDTRAEPVASIWDGAIPPPIVPG